MHCLEYPPLQQDALPTQNHKGNKEPFADVKLELCIANPQ